MAQRSLPASEIHAFEIIPSTFDILATRVTNAKLNNFGLFDRNGIVKMFAYDASNKYASHMPYPHGSATPVQCRVCTGDQYMADNNIDHIDYLKIDTEGAESNVIGGFRKAITAKKIKAIQFEYGHVNIMTHALLYDYYSFFSEHGYKIGKLQPDGIDFKPYDFSMEDFQGPNYIAMLASGDE